MSTSATGESALSLGGNTNTFSSRERREGREVSVQDLVNLNFQVEELERSCSQCGASKASAQSALSRLPRVLVLYLKRHSYHHRTGAGGAGKSRTKVIIPPTLSFSDHVNLTLRLPPELPQEEFPHLSDVKSPSEIVAIPESVLCLKSPGRSGKRKWKECGGDKGDSSLQSLNNNENNNQEDRGLATVLRGSAWQAGINIFKKNFNISVEKILIFEDDIPGLFAGAAELPAAECGQSPGVDGHCRALRGGRLQVRPGELAEVRRPAGDQDQPGGCDLG